MFKAPNRNLQLFSFVSVQEQKRDRNLKALQNMIGTKAAIASETWEHTNQLWELQSQLAWSLGGLVTSSEEGNQFQAYNSVISQFARGTRFSLNIINQGLVVKMRKNLLLSAATFNNFTTIRRKLAIENIVKVGETKYHLDKCQTSDEFLFGSRMKDLVP